MIEQAKRRAGHTANIDMAAAYDLLTRRAAENGASLSETAAQNIQDAQAR